MKILCISILKLTLTLSSLCLLFSSLPSSTASDGDISSFFERCRGLCYLSNCSTAEKQQKFNEKHPIILKVMQWSCLDECQYNCMWPTVTAFEKAYGKVPKFYGKWPFIRILGIQEIASSVASLLNLLSHIYMIRVFRRRIKSKAPMFYLWNIVSIVSVNTWFWSLIFHARDTPFTEKMDYFCAISAVMYNLFIFIYRTTLGNFALHLSIGSMMLFYFSYHVYYLSFVNFDYGYNMRVNIAVGLSNAVGWLSWYMKVRKRQPYAYKCAVCIVAALLLLMLEIRDFPPLFWIFDAHSLWHFGTAPIAFMWYSFAIDDCLYLERKFYKKFDLTN